MLDSSGVIRQLVEMAEPLIDPAEEEEIERLERAIALSLTSPIVAIQQPVPAKASRVARFNLPLLDPPDRTPPRFVPVVPRLRSVRFRPPPAPVTPKPGPPIPAFACATNVSDHAFLPVDRAATCESALRAGS